MDKNYNVLFLCTGNSARSVMAEVLLNDLGKGKFKAFSAGSHPSGRVNPFTIELLRRQGHSTDQLRSKRWEEFAAVNSPILDFVITVCDNAVGEVCPVWPGQPMSAHWGFEDPAAFHGTDDEICAKFREIYLQIGNRLRLFLSLPMDRIDRLALQKQVRDLGSQQP